MMDKPEERSRQENETPACGSVSRREFLKMAGIAGATIGVGAGLGGLLAACGGDEETTTTAGETTTTMGETTTTAGGATTTAAGAEMGREVKIGWVTMTTGVFAGLSEPDDFLLNQAKETIGDGLVCADGLKHPIAWIVKDSQSDPNRAAEVAGELITQDKPDIIFGGMTPGGQHPCRTAVRGERRALHHLRVSHGAVVLRHGRRPGCRLQVGLQCVLGHLGPECRLPRPVRQAPHQQEGGLPVGQRPRWYRHGRRGHRLPG